MKKSVLITGTSSGIGYQAVKRFSQKGFDIIATVRKASDQEKLQKQFPEITVLNLDLDNEALTTKLIGAELEKINGVDVLVNNAGFAQIGPVELLDMQQWRNQMETNFFAVINLTRLVLPYMREKGFGRVVQVSSGFGQVVMPIFGPYCASKFALEAFSESLRYEVGQFGVSVSLIEPGPVATSFDANRQLPEETAIQGSPYETLFRNVQGRVKKGHENASTADDVVDKIFDAATAANPKLRYKVGLLGYASAIPKFLPARVVEKGLKPLVG